MKNILKRASIFILTAAMAVSAAGCYSENNLWAAKKDDIELPLGGYVLYLTNAYSEAAGLLDPDVKVLDGRIDDKDSKTWIADKAKDSALRYFYLEEKFKDLGLSLSEEELADMESYTSFYWNTYGYGPVYEAMGISRDSFEKAEGRPSYLSNKIFDALYAPDGEFGISDEELSEYYEENYYSYEYFTVSRDKVTEEDDHAHYTEEEEAEIKEMLEDYVQKINRGRIDISEAAEDYQETVKDNQEEIENSSEAAEENPEEAESEITTTYTDGERPLADATSEISMAIAELDEDSDAVLVEAAEEYAIVRRRVISDKTEEMLSDESSRDNVLYTWKNDEFTAYVDEEYPKTQGVTWNDSALKTYDVKKLVTDQNKYGIKESSEEVSEETEG